MRLINADALLEILNKEKIPYNSDVNYFIMHAPTIDAVPVRHGYWKGKPIAGYSTVRCTQCGDVFLENSGNWNYCPTCGAKMDKDEWEEPEINPCRGCIDYDGQGGCKSNGGCGVTDEVN